MTEKLQPYAPRPRPPRFPDTPSSATDRQRPPTNESFRQLEDYIVELSRVVVAQQEEIERLKGRAP